MAMVGRCSCGAEHGEQQSAVFVRELPGTTRCDLIPRRARWARGVSLDPPVCCTVMLGLKAMSIGAGVLDDSGAGELHATSVCRRLLRKRPGARLAPAHNPLNCL